MKGSNPGAMPENLKQNEGIESGRDAGEPETKEGSNVSKGVEKRLCPSLRQQYHVRNPPFHIKSKSQTLKC